MATERRTGRVVLAIAVLAAIGVVLWFSWERAGPRPVGPPRGFEQIRMGMGLDELKAAMPGLTQPKSGLTMYEVRPDKPDPYNMITFLIAGGGVTRALFFVDPKKSSVGAFDRLVAELQRDLGRPPDEREKEGRSPQRTWCDKLNCIGVNLLPVPVPGLKHDHVYVTFETAGAHKRKAGNVKVFDMTGKLPAPPRAQ